MTDNVVMLTSNPYDEAAHLYGSLRSMRDLGARIIADSELLRAGRITARQANARFAFGQELLNEVRKTLGLRP